MSKGLVFLLLTTAICLFPHQDKGQIFFGQNLAKPLNQHTDRLYLRINDSEKLFFNRQYDGPAIDNLDIGPDHLVRVYFDDQIVESWVLNFKQIKSQAVIIWRSPGSWRMEPHKNSVVMREGDLIFHSSQSAQSMAIQLATHSQYSHMGIILYQSGKPYVFEAVTTVRFTPLSEWISRGQNQDYVLKRLKDADKTLTPQVLDRIRALAKKFENISYDYTFEWSDSRMYCSELVWKIFDRVLAIQIGKPQKLGEFDLSSPAVKTKLLERYGSAIPYDEPVISPVEMFNSDWLVTIEGNSQSFNNMPY